MKYNFKKQRFSHDDPLHGTACQQSALEPHHFHGNPGNLRGVHCGVTELFILLSRNVNGTLKQLNRIAGIIIGIYFTGVFIYLLINAVIPLTVSGGWRGIADVIAVSFYLLGIIPLAGMALMGLGIIGKNADEQGKLKLHATFVAIFLVVAHIAMIFGMLNPELLI